MNLSIGIIGLPNVGKSTLFNALLKKQQALVANYPFATIEPNIGIVPVPDPRLNKLAEIVRASTPGVEPPIKPATVQFVDIAGLVKGAAEGAGLGNKFLSHIREVSIIAHVVRAFSDENIIKEGSIDPRSDYQTIQTELMLADLQTLENSKRKSQSAKQQLKSQNQTIEKLTSALYKGIPARDVQLSDEEREVAKELFLLSAKLEIVALNVNEEQLNSESVKQVISDYSNQLFSGLTDQLVVVCAKIESELSELSEDEQKEYLRNLGLEESGLERLIKKAYETLGLISFLTAGEKEIRAWTIRRGSTALAASGTIHTDFEKKFIKAEVVSFDDFVQNGGWKGSKEAGKARFEGRDYIVNDGDIIEFKIGS